MTLQLKRQFSSNISDETNRLLHAEHEYVFEISVSHMVLNETVIWHNI